MYTLDHADFLQRDLSNPHGQVTKYTLSYSVDGRPSSPWWRTGPGAWRTRATRWLWAALRARYLKLDCLKGQGSYVPAAMAEVNVYALENEEPAGKDLSVAVSGADTVKQDQRVPYTFSFSGEKENLGNVTVVFNVKGDQEGLFTGGAFEAGEGFSKYVLDEEEQADGSRQVKVVLAYGMDELTTLEEAALTGELTDMFTYVIRSSAEQGGQHRGHRGAGDLHLRGGQRPLLRRRDGRHGQHCRVVEGPLRHRRGRRLRPGGHHRGRRATTARPRATRTGTRPGRRT